MANGQLIASDSFSGGAMAAGWTVFPGGQLATIGGSGPYYAYANVTATACGGVWTGTPLTNDHVSEVTVKNLDATNGFITIQVRFSSSTKTGYQVNFNAGQMKVFYYSNGAAGSPIVTVSGLTISPGDVLAFQAAGACLTVWQNGNRLWWGNDITYLTGYPGFALSTPSSTTYAQIWSWRCYNAVQQDGIWTKQGLTMPATGVHDISANPTGLWNSFQILYEGSPKILAGPTVYKVWFTNQTDGVLYAESADGVNWTRYGSNPVLAGYKNAFIIKNGGTYYLYARSTAGGMTGNIALFSSSDGITWTSVNTNVFGLTGAQAWESAGFWFFQPVTINGGTWYALYSATNDLTNVPMSVGLATSSDGQTWTRSGSNPVLSNASNNSSIINIGGTWYMWAGACRLGAGNLTTPDVDPTECVRYQSTDLIHWTNPVKSLHNTELFESLNSTTGQTYPGAILDVNGKAYMYSVSSPGDSTNPACYQWSLATAPVSVKKVVLYKEDGALQQASDNFASGPGGLSGNWTTPTGATALHIVTGNYCEPSTTSTPCGAVYTGAGAFASSQYSEITIHALSASGQYFTPMVYGQTGSFSGYQALIQGPTGSGVAGASLQTLTSGTAHSFGPTATIKLSAGDVIRLTVTKANDGNNLLSLYQNGFLVLQVQDYSNTYTSGYPGVVGSETVAGDAQASLWAGGALNILPYPASGAGLLLGVG